MDQTSQQTNPSAHNAQDCSMLRCAALVGKVNASNPADCMEEIRQALPELPPGLDLLVLPKFALCSPSCGSMFQSPALLGGLSEALEALCAETRELDGYVIAGTVAEDWGRPVSAMAVIYRGELIALVPALDGPAAANGRRIGDALPANTVFAAGDIRFCVLPCGFDDLAIRCVQVAQTGCDLIVIPAYEPVWAGRIGQVRQIVRALSASTGCGILVVNGGVGDTSSPYAYRGFICLCEAGRELAFAEGGGESFHLTADLDIDVLRACKRSRSGTGPIYSIPPAQCKTGLFRAIGRCPFLPAEGKAEYLDELFDLQARSLAARMENSGITKLVLAVSGGLDSTMAMLVCIRALAILDLPRENILGITLPGFGTSDSTYYNALSLMEKLGVARRDIPIRAAVRQHFEDIGHTGVKDVAYENAQARERTQIALDLANMIGGLMVGTGDLSEEALGFCTYGGDQMAGYNVNICLTKTVIRELVGHIADNDMLPEISDVLRAILDTPVSPELLPPDEFGAIRQKTEDILGPYILHDFFLYHFVKYHFPPVKIFRYACAAFAGELEPAFIREKLSLFIRRFCAGQFKRACSPDAASITEVNLLGVSYHIPSDLDPSFLLKGLEGVEA